ncbi:MAG: Type-1 restriction enzyme EcoKI specificity protein [Pelotomaculum sp. PtaU1.Bin035]|nr:MAG: Type-1 restriction enzyme EcoKI specificity protein [Pelotomaculum sp. PtaU1.Bin035]
MVTWEEVELLSLSNGGMQNGVFYEVSRKGSGIPLINVGDLYQSAPITYERLELFDANDDEIKRFSVNDGDLFFTRSSVVASGIAHCNYYRKTTEKKPVVFDSHVIRFKTDTTKVVPMYLYLQCISPKARKFFVANAKTATMTTIDQDILGKCLIDLPPLPEQRAIAAALSDMDGYIAALEQLIAKKRAVKQGAMQELLTGKRRLPGFSGEWVEKKLGDLFDITSSKRVFQSEWRPSGVPFYRAREIAVLSEKGSVDNELFISYEMYEQYTREYGSIQSDDVLITGVGTLGKVYVVKEGDRFYFKDGNIIWLKSKHLINSNFLRQLYFTEAIISQVFGTSGGSTVGTYTIKNANETIVPYPPLDEQTAIAEILSDMDAEIDALTAKLNKLRNIKQGMMSELLSGRIRLTEQEAAPEAVAATKSAELPKQETATETAHKGGHNQQFDDAVMIAGIVNALYSDKYPLGRKKVQKCLYLLRRHQDESTAAFKKKAAGPYADEVRYKGGEPIAQSAHYIATTTVKDKGTTFARGSNISQALGYIKSWGKQGDIQWVTDKLKFKKVDELELLATVDMAICDLEEAGTAVSVAAIKHLIATNEEWKAKLKKQTFSDANIARAIRELQTLLQGGN